MSHIVNTEHGRRRQRPLRPEPLYLEYGDIGISYPMAEGQDEATAMLAGLRSAIKNIFYEDAVRRNAKATRFRTTEKFATAGIILDPAVVKRAAKLHPHIQQLGPDALWRQLAPAVPADRDSATLVGRVEPALYPTVYHDTTLSIAGLCIQNTHMESIGREVYDRFNKLIGENPDNMLQSPHLQLGIVPFGIPPHLQDPILEIIGEAVTPGMTMTFLSEPTLPARRTQ